MIIYKATNKINEKKYIGQTVFDLEHRKSGHIRSVLHKDTGMYFHKALKKYGVDNFDWETLHECNTIDELNRLEIFYIKHYNTFGNGYNLNSGGSNALHSDETKQKIAKANIGNQRALGYHHSEETKREMSRTRKGRTGWNKGLCHSEETKKKISDSSPRLSGKNHSMARAVIIKNKFFDTCKEASEFTKIPASTIRYRIKRQDAGYQYADEISNGTRLLQKNHPRLDKRS